MASKHEGSDIQMRTDFMWTSNSHKRIRQLLLISTDPLPTLSIENFMQPYTALNKMDFWSPQKQNRFPYSHGLQTQNADTSLTMRERQQQSHPIPKAQKFHLYFHLQLKFNRAPVFCWSAEKITQFTLNDILFSTLIFPCSICYLRYQEFFGNEYYNCSSLLLTKAL